MLNQNLMEVNSPNIGTMTNIYDYQRLFINNKIGEALNKFDAKIREDYQIYLKNSFEEVFKKLEENYNVYKCMDTSFYIIEDEFVADFYILNLEDKNCLYVSLLSSSKTKCQEIIQKIKDTIKEFTKEEQDSKYILMQNNNGSVGESHLSVKEKFEFEALSYPFIEDIDKYIQSYLNSDSPILLLYGEAGTGKSTFTKYLLKKLKEEILKKDKYFKVAYSFDESILHLSEFYHKYLSNDNDIYVFEDINSILLKSENSFDYNPLDRLVSVTDGLISNNKKIIISTNIENLYHINEKLIRPGRCFDTLNFRALEKKELEKLSKKYNISLDKNTSTLNLSEFFARLYNQENQNLLRSKIGY